MENQQPNQEAPDHVLVVDDDAEIRTLLAEYLSQNGIRVTVARDATEMRQVFDEARPDIIILDLMMPGEDGLTVCRELRSRSNVPVIMLTARAVSMMTGTLERERSSRQTVRPSSPGIIRSRMMMSGRASSKTWRISVASRATVTRMPFWLRYSASSVRISASSSTTRT